MSGLPADPSRRAFIRQGLLTAGAAGLGLAGLQACGGTERPPPPHPALGPLQATRDETTGLALLMLPEGFRYRTMAWAGESMSDGFPGPGRCDGMGVVASDGQYHTLIRNHELRGSSGPIGRPETAWDVTGGGTTTLVFNHQAERLESAYVSLNGTLNNCAGGVTPWGTWLSCEEAVLTPELRHHGIQSRQRHWGIEHARKSHGWVFEVDPAGVGTPRPLEAMGQFYHEAAAVDPVSGCVYMTEDSRPYAGLYRYLPEVPGQLAGGGRLQMMRVEGRAELTDSVGLFTPMPVDWVDIAEPTRGHTPGSHDARGVVEQGMRAGGTGFRALEGCALHHDTLLFTSKDGGAANRGLVFRFDPQSAQLEAIYEAGPGEQFSGPDNIIVSPRGSLVICEDREDSDPVGQFLAGLTPAGQLFAFCQLLPDLGGTYAGHALASTARVSEWAGACFSPDGKWLFANIFKPGLTCAITGPWVDGLI
jgi:hypothetical protein